MGVLGNLLSEKGKFGVGENWLKNGKNLSSEKRLRVFGRFLWVVGKRNEKDRKNKD